jgi:hypothetical protein
MPSNLTRGYPSALSVVLYGEWNRVRLTRQAAFLLLMFGLLTGHGVYALERVYPDLISYDFIQSDIYLHQIWLDKELDHVAEAEFLIKSVKLATSADYAAPSVRLNDGRIKTG